MRDVILAIDTSEDSTEVTIKITGADPLTLNELRKALRTAMIQLAESSVSE